MRSPVPEELRSASLLAALVAGALLGAWLGCTVLVADPEGWSPEGPGDAGALGGAPDATGDDWDADSATADAAGPPDAATGPDASQPTSHVCDGGTPTADDRDGDGIPNARDNCADDCNPCQQDKDEDGIGDACDPVCDPGCRGNLCQEWGAEGIPCDCARCPAGYSSVADNHQPIGICPSPPMHCFCVRPCTQMSDCPRILQCSNVGGCWCTRLSITTPVCLGDAGVDAG